MKLSKAFLASLVIHALVFIPWIFWKKSSAPLSGGGGGNGHGSRVSVEIVSAPAQTTNTSRPIEVTPTTRGELPILKKETKTSPQPSSGSSGPIGPGTGEGQGLGSGTDGGESAVLALIRSKIEQAKRYPEIAKRAGIMGNVLISFSITSEGQPENISVKNSSGADLLDSEAKNTVQRAAPLPYYPEPLEIMIKFEIEE